MKRIILISLTLVLTMSLSVYALEIKGVKLPDSVEISEPLQLVGAGIRTKTFLRINVYIGALYMVNPVKNADAVIGAKEAKRMVMHFLYHKVAKEKIIKGWNEGFEANSRPSLDTLQERIATFNSFFDSDLKEGDEAILTYIPGKGTNVEIKGVVKGTIPGDDFMEALFKIWFGEHPADKDLKEEILTQ